VRKLGVACTKHAFLGAWGSDCLAWVVRSSSTRCWQLLVICNSPPPLSLVAECLLHQCSVKDLVGDGPVYGAIGGIEQWAISETNTTGLTAIERASAYVCSSANAVATLPLLCVTLCLLKPGPVCCLRVSACALLAVRCLSPWYVLSGMTLCTILWPGCFPRHAL
jgi:hypothetical protein